MGLLAGGGIGGVLLRCSRRAFWRIRRRSLGGWMGGKGGRAGGRRVREKGEMEREERTDRNVTTMHQLKCSRLRKC